MTYANLILFILGCASFVCFEIGGAKQVTCPESAAMLVIGTFAGLSLSVAINAVRKRNNIESCGTSANSSTTPASKQASAD